MKESSQTEIMHKPLSKTGNNLERGGGTDLWAVGHANIKGGDRSDVCKCETTLVNYE